MEISPKIQNSPQKESPMEIETETSNKTVAEKPQNKPMARSDSKKRKIEELDYEELGEPIQGEKSKSAAVKRLEAALNDSFLGFL